MPGSTLSEYVISKSPENWYVYVTNSFTYKVDENGFLVVDRIFTTYRIVNKNDRLTPYKKIDIVEVDVPDYFKIDLISGSGIEWISDNHAKLKNAFFDDIDFIVLGDDNYLSVRKKFNKDWTFEIFFEDGFNKDQFSELEVVAYRIGDTMFKEETITSGFIHEDEKPVVSFENPFESNKCKCLVFDNNGVAYDLKNVDLTPSKVRIHEDELGIDKTMPIPISSAKVYTFTKCSSKVARYGLDTDGVEWDENAAYIRHNLNGIVNVVVDDTIKSGTTYSVKFVSPNEIEIDFKKDPDDYVVCGVRCFKIGEMR